MGRAYAVLPHRLAQDCYPHWLVAEFQRLRREEFDDWIWRVRSTEIGVARALAAGFGKKPGNLPTWDDVTQGVSEEEPDWIQRYREANRLDLPKVD